MRDQGIGDGYGNGHNGTGTPPHVKGNQCNHGDNRLPKAFDQAVDLVVGGLSVISCDLVAYVVGQHVLLQVLHAFFDLPGNPDRIAALFLGHSDGNRRERVVARHLPAVFCVGRSETDTAVGKNLLGTILHLRNIPQVDRSALVKGNEQILDLPDIS